MKQSSAIHAARELASHLNDLENVRGVLLLSKTGRLLAIDPNHAPARHSWERANALVDPDTTATSLSTTLHTHPPTHVSTGALGRWTRKLGILSRALESGDLARWIADGLPPLKKWRAHDLGARLDRRALLLARFSRARTLCDALGPLEEGVEFEREEELLLALELHSLALLPPTLRPARELCSRALLVDASLIQICHDDTALTPFKHAAAALLGARHAEAMRARLPAPLHETYEAGSLTHPDVLDTLVVIGATLPHAHALARLPDTTHPWALPALARCHLILGEQVTDQLLDEALRPASAPSARRARFLERWRDAIETILGLDDGVLVDAWLPPQLEPLRDPSARHERALARAFRDLARSSLPQNDPPPNERALVRAIARAGEDVSEDLAARGQVLADILANSPLPQLRHDLEPVNYARRAALTIATSGLPLPIPAALSGASMRRLADIAQVHEDESLLAIWNTLVEQPAMIENYGVRRLLDIPVTWRAGELDRLIRRDAAQKIHTLLDSPDALRAYLDAIEALAREDLLDAVPIEQDWFITLFKDGSPKLPRHLLAIASIPRDGQRDTLDEALVLRLIAMPRGQDAHHSPVEDALTRWCETPRDTNPREELDHALDHAWAELLSRELGRAITPQMLPDGVRDLGGVLQRLEQQRALFFSLLDDLIADRPLRERAPNQAWLTRATRDGVDTTRWLQGFDDAITSNHGAYRVHTEHDPIEALRAYSILDARQGHGYLHTDRALIDTLDANRQTIFIRDPDDQLVAYRRIAVSSPTHLVGFQTHDFDMLSPTLRASIDACIMRFAHTCNLTLATSPAPDELHASRRDGLTEAWRVLDSHSPLANNLQHITSQPDRDAHLEAALEAAQSEGDTATLELIFGEKCWPWSALAMRAILDLDVALASDLASAHRSGWDPSEFFSAKILAHRSLAPRERIAMLRDTFPADDPWRALSYLIWVSSLERGLLEQLQSEVVALAKSLPWGEEKRRRVDFDLRHISKWTGAPTAEVVALADACFVLFDALRQPFPRETDSARAEAREMILVSWALDHDDAPILSMLNDTSSEHTRHLLLDVLAVLRLPGAATPIRRVAKDLPDALARPLILAAARQADASLLPTLHALREKHPALRDELEGAFAACGGAHDSNSEERAVKRARRRITRHLDAHIEEPTRDLLQERELDEALDALANLGSPLATDALLACCDLCELHLEWFHGRRALLLERARDASRRRAREIAILATGDHRLTLAELPWEHHDALPEALDPTLYHVHTAADGADLPTRIAAAEQQLEAFDIDTNLATFHAVEDIIAQFPQAAIAIAYSHAAGSIGLNYITPRHVDALCNWMAHLDPSTPVERAGDMLRMSHDDFGVGALYLIERAILEDHRASPEQRCAMRVIELHLPGQHTSGALAFLTTAYLMSPAPAHRAWLRAQTERFILEKGDDLEGDEICDGLCEPYWGDSVMSSLVFSRHVIDALHEHAPEWVWHDLLEELGASSRARAAWLLDYSRGLPSITARETSQT